MGEHSSPLRDIVIVGTNSVRSLRLDVIIVCWFHYQSDLNNFVKQNILYLCAQSSV